MPRGWGGLEPQPAVVPEQMCSKDGSCAEKVAFGAVDVHKRLGERLQNEGTCTQGAHGN